MREISKFRIGNVVKHLSQERYGRIKCVLGSEAFEINWFNDNNIDSNPTYSWEIALFCRGKRLKNCEQCDIRYPCWSC